MPKPCYRMRDNEAGVSEVVGTLLILAMTTALFATIIIWVSNIPTPPATTKLDMDASYAPIRLDGTGANVTIRHKGGEDLNADDVRLYVTVTRGGIPSTTVLKVAGTYANVSWYLGLAGKPYGLVDGRDSYWNIGERWQWSNYSALPTDTISAIVVDHVRNRVMWSGEVLGAPGTHPPIFLDKWADRVWSTPTVDTPWTGAAFHIMARMTDADSDLVRVNGTLTIFFGTPSSCKDPQMLADDGTNGDITAGDGVWTLYRTCMDSPSLAWDGSVVLFNATDAKGHYTTSRLILAVEANPGGETGLAPFPETGRPPNLRYNGLQGFNIFNGSEWTNKEFFGEATHTFKANEQVVVVIGSVLLTDSRGQNQFVLSDPFSGIPADPVVYGASKTVTFATRPSNNQAFTFYKYVNGYNVFVYTFDLNNPSTVGTNYYAAPSPHPQYYFFAHYPLKMTITDSSGAQFVAADAINVTDLDGSKRNFPVVTTFFDSAFTGKSKTFQSTATVYVQVSMFTVDVDNTKLLFGNMVIRDFSGGTQLFKAPISGRTANSPICPVTAACTGTNNVFTVDSPTVTYRFAINLSRADQDGWVDGVQTYSLTLASVDDADERYANLAVSLVIVAPLYRHDIVIGTADATPSGTADEIYGLAYKNVNGVDRFERTPLLDQLSRGPGLTKLLALKYLDFDQDGDLDVASSSDNKVISVHRFDLDSFGNPVFTRYQIITNTVVCNDIGTGDVTADLAPEIVCGFANGHVIYYKNDGAWTPVTVDTTRAGIVKSVDVADFNGDGANDIAVGRADNRITYYLNRNGQGEFANIALTDDWFAETDLTSIGTIVPPNSYLATLVSDDTRESIEEVTLDEPVVTNATVNSGFDADNASWTYVDWETPAKASGSRKAAGGNPGGYVDITMDCVASAKVSGFWAQAFTVSGAGPWAATVGLHYKVVQKGTSASSITMYAFVDRTLAVPVPGQEVWQKVETGTTSWLVPAPVAAGTKIVGPGVYYLKVVAQTQYGVGCGPMLETIVGFDNATLSWSSTAGPVSELKHYWRIQQLPNRPSSSYWLNFEGHRSASGDGDQFSVAYAVGTAASPPTDSAFTGVFTVAASSDAPFSAALPANVGGTYVWVRVEDTDRRAGNTTNDRVAVDRMYIHIETLAATTGNDHTVDGAANSIDAGDQESDGNADLVVGTSSGKIYKFLGSPGGLTAPAGTYYTALSSPVIGIKLMNGTMTSPGLEIAYGDNLKRAFVITGSGSSGLLISGALDSAGPDNLAALGSGDLDGDGDDDIVLATTSGALRYWRNLGGSTAWEYTDIDNVTAAIYDIDIGDMSNSDYPGR